LEFEYIDLSPTLYATRLVLSEVGACVVVEVANRHQIS